MPFIGNAPSNNFVSLKRQDITGDGTASYTLDYKVASVNDVLIYVNHVKQDPSSYSISGTSLTMGGTVASTDDFYIIYLGQGLQTVTPADNTITTAMLQDDAVTAAKATGFGKIGQVVQTVKTDTTSQSSASTWNDISGISVSITPTSTSSKVLVIPDLALGGSNMQSYHLIWRLVRGSTAIAVSTSATDADLTGTGGMHKASSGASAYYFGTSKMFLDSPATTSATTYKCQWSANDSGATLYLNRRGSGTTAGGISTITAMEVLA